MTRNQLEHLQAIGAPRDSDEFISEESRKEALRWVKAYKTKASTTNEDKTGSSLVAYYNTLAAAGKLGASATKVSGLGENLMTRSLNFLFKKLKKGYENVVEIGRRRRKYALVGGGAVAGAAIGALLGTFVLPGLGTAIGGAAGAAITSAVATLGGVVGTSVITAGLGAYVGNTVGKNLDDSETAYKFKPSIKQALSTKGNLSEGQSTSLYAYLRNRQDHVLDPDVKQAIKLMKNSVFKKGEMKALNSLSFYLCHELETLSTMERLSKQQKKDLLLVTDLLKNLQKADIEKKTKSHIKQALEKQNQDKHPQRKSVSDTHAKSKKKQNVGRSLVFDKSSPTPVYSGLIVAGHSNQILKEKSDAFKSDLNHVFRDLLELDSIEIEKTESEDKQKRTLHYQLDLSNKNRIDFTIKERNLEQGIQTKFLMAPTQDKEQATDALIAATRVYLKNLPQEITPQLKVVSGGSQEIAIRLLTCAYQQGLKPILDENEFPDEELRKNLTKQAEELAHKSPRLRPGKGLN